MFVPLSPGNIRGSSPCQHRLPVSSSVHGESYFGYKSREHCTLKSHCQNIGLLLLLWSRDSVVGLRAGRVKNFLSSKSSRSALRSTQPPIQWVPGDLSSGVERQGREADHSPPTSAEVKKMSIYTSTPRTPSRYSA
jgi:hypothetical protein